MSLFRPEVLAHRADRLQGDVNLAVPVAWQVIGGGLLAALVVTILFLSLASYARVETVSGNITTNLGVATVAPTHPGIVEAITARENASVAAGAALVRIKATDILSNGQAAQANVIEAIRAQDSGLAAQSLQQNAAAGAEQARQAATIAGLRRQIASIDQQLAVSRDLVVTTREELDRALKVSKGGFVSHHDLNLRQENWLNHRQQVMQLEGDRASKISAIEEAQRAADQIGATARAQAAGIAASRSELTQRSITTDAQRAFVMSAPIAGEVTALTARVGQTVATDTPLMVIVPQGSVITAELQVPTSAVGFLSIGQEVRLAVDAFPFERFGTVRGRITTVARSAVARGNDKGGTTPVYIVTASIADPTVTAFGRKQRLLPGMALSARIVTRKQSLIEWLFEPVFAVRNR